MKPPVPSAPAQPPSALDSVLADELAALAAADRLRSTHPFSGSDRVHPPGSLIAFCSNDYLGLAGHPALAAALKAASDQSSAGSGAARLVNGETPEHLALEAALAAFVDRPTALLYPTGYLTNLGVITALATAGDLIVSDAANHASIIDGCRLSRARVQIYPHCDATSAAAALLTPGPFRRRILVTESIFSMDGDRAPLPALASAAREANAALIVDEAHALGVAGPAGRGVCAATGVNPTVLIGTLGKAFGTAGGFATGSPTLRTYLINKSRPFIYSTAPSPAIAVASLAAVQLARGPEGDHLRARAQALATRIRNAVRSTGPTIPGEDLILPLVVGADGAALSLAARLRNQGLLVPAIRPPTVAPGTARLRITVSAAHSDSDVDALLTALEGIGAPA